MKRLLHALNYMPLTITQIEAFISERHNILQDVQKGDIDRARLLNRYITILVRRDGNASNLIIMTWQILKIAAKRRSQLHSCVSSTDKGFRSLSSIIVIRD